MLKNIGHGWSKFELGDFIGHPSYLTFVPGDLLNAFIQYYENGASAVEFDEEGSTFVLVLTFYSAYIIERKDEEILHVVDKDIDELAKEAYQDVTNDLESWVDFSYSDEESEKENIRNTLHLLLNSLKELIGEDEV